MTTLPLITDPLQLFKCQMKDKNLKRSSIRNLRTIILCLKPGEFSSHFLPLLKTTYINENSEYKVQILSVIISILELCDLRAKVELINWLTAIATYYTENNIRTEACKSLQAVVQSVFSTDTKHILPAYWSLVETLAFNSDCKWKKTALKLILYAQKYLIHQWQVKMQDLLQKYTINEEDALILSQECLGLVQQCNKEGVQFMYLLLKNLLAKANPQISQYLIEPLLQVAARNQPGLIWPQLHQLQASESIQVKIALISSLHSLKKVYKIQELEWLQIIYKQYQEQKHQVKKALLEVVDEWPEMIEVVINCKDTMNSLQLKNTLLNSLCRLNDYQSIVKLFNNADNDFKIKLFHKLPPISSYHEKILADIFDHKNWRGKLSVLQNLHQRVEAGEIAKPILPFLIQCLSSKVAVVRTKLLQLIELCLREKQAEINDVKDLIIKGAKSRNWYERQAHALLIRSQRVHLQQKNPKLFDELIGLFNEQSVMNVLLVFQTD